MWPHVLNCKMWPCLLPALMDKLYHNNQLSISNSEAQIRWHLPLLFLTHYEFSKSFHWKSFFVSPLRKIEGLIGSIGNFKKVCFIIIFFMSLRSIDLRARIDCLESFVSWNTQCLLLFLIGTFSFCCFIRGCNC